LIPASTPYPYTTLFRSNLILIPVLGRYGYGHVGPPLATALASSLNVWMLYRTLRAREHFRTDARLRRKVPRLMIAALIMGAMLLDRKSTRLNSSHDQIS